ncbi:hypothetical protein [Capnocytophaga leadbetteri]|uniref:hypothetical protein n=1 Tax=Capnocytophaga leadbetteri TaxID=327575 RepID=UPI0028EA9572|nr:hypothetical protein [Capnocytophaga leadbetteri]
MKETLEQELVDLATEIIAYQGRLNLSELSQKAHKISEKITILGFVEKYYQMLRTSEQRMTYTLRKVANFIDEQENIFNIDVAFKELQPLEQPLIEETQAEKPAFVAMEPAPVQAAAEPIAEKIAEPAPAEPAPAEPVHFATPPAEPTPAAEPVPVEPIHFTTTPAEATPAAEPAPAEPVHFTTTPAEPTPAAEPAPAEPVHFTTTPAEPTPAEPIHFATPPVETAPAPAEVSDTTTDSVVEMTQFASPEAAITEPTAAQPVADTSDEDLTSLYQDWNDWHSYTLPDDPPAEVAAPVSAPVATPAPAATRASEVAPAQTTVAAPVAQAVAQPVENTTPPTTINTQQPLREASTPDWAVSIEQPIVPPRPQQAETSHEPIHAAAPEQAPTSVVEQVLTAERLHPHQAAQPTAAAQAPVAQPVQSALSENFIQQQHLTEEQQILRQTPSLEEFLAKSKATAFDKKDHTEEVKPTQSLNDRFSKEIQIGLNDKLAFIQKLFFGSESEYNRVLQHLNQLHSLEEAAQYIQQQVKPTYNNWKGKEEYEERFLHLILRRFE